MVIASTLLGLLFVLLGAVTAFAFLLPPKQQGQSAWSQRQAPYQYPNLLVRGRTILASSVLSFASTTQSSIEDLKTLLAQHQDSPEYSALSARLQTLESRLDKLAQLYSDVQDKKSALDTAQQNYESAVEAEAKTKATLQAASDNKKAQEETLMLKQVIRQEASDQVTEADEQYDLMLQNYTTSQEQLAQQLAVYETAVITLHEAQVQKDLAQSNYNTLLQSYNNPNTYIPDPNWTVPTQLVEHTRQVANTRLVPHTELVQRVGYSFQESSNILPPLSHTTWSGAGTGFQGSQPTINNNTVKFSYMNQSVTYATQANLAGTLALTVDALNLDANRGQQDTYEIRLRTYNAQGDVNGEAYHYVNYWHDWMTRTIEVTPSSPVTYYEVTLTGFDAGYWYGTYGPEIRNPRLSAIIQTETIYYEEVTTYIEETYYTTETYYTEEPVLVQGTLNVDIREGGQATFTAPEGATFISSNLRYEAISRPTCGANITPQVNGLSQITIRALNSVWGDPCGGWVKHVVGTLSYLGQPTAPLIPNPAIYAQLQEAETNLSEAQSNLDYQNQNLLSVIEEKERREQALQVATENLASAQENLSAKEDALASAQLEEEAQTTQYNQAELNYAIALSEHQSAQDHTANTQQQLTSHTQTYETAQQEAETFSTQVDADYQSLSTDVSNIQPAPEEEQQPLIDLAAVPVLGEALSALSDVGEALANIGSDMSPEVREQAQKVVVSAIVVTQVATQAAQIATQAAQAAQAAAASASAASSSGSSGSSSAGRRK